MNNSQAWEPISEAELTEQIDEGEALMEPALSEFWKRIRIRPVKWTLHPIGDIGGGFWVVGVIGQRCVWFNDVEDGFNLSQFSTFGEIGEEFCNQDDLAMCIRRLFNNVPGGNFGPAEPLPFSEP